MQKNNTIKGRRELYCKKNCMKRYNPATLPPRNFVIYLAATAFLIDDFTYAYQISSTNFDSLAHSVLFSGNIHRLKALSAEQIFLQYYDPKDPENSFPVMAYLVEAIQSATKALDLYKGIEDGSNGFQNEYGMGL